MTAQIDFTGFYCRTDRMHEAMREELLGLTQYHPALRDVGLQVSRSLFGTCSTRLLGTYADAPVEIETCSLDPMDAFDRCIDRLKDHLTAHQDRRLA